MLRTPAYAPLVGHRAASIVTTMQVVLPVHSLVKGQHKQVSLATVWEFDDYTQVKYIGINDKIIREAHQFCAAVQGMRSQSASDACMAPFSLTAISDHFCTCRSSVYTSSSCAL